MENVTPEEKIARKRLVLLTKYEESLRHEKRARHEAELEHKRGEEIMAELIEVELAIEKMQEQAERKAAEERWEKLLKKAEEMHPNDTCETCNNLPLDHFTDHELEFSEYHASIDVPAPKIVQ